MPVVGYATMPVIPTFRGVSGAITSGITAPAASAGASAGRSAGRGLLGGLGGAAKTAGKIVGVTLGVGIGAVAAGVGTVAGLSLRGGFDRALNIQDAQKQLIGLGHSTSEVTKIMGNALSSVKGTAFGLDAAATVAASTVAAGIKPGRELERTLKLTADAATIAKTPLNEMGSIINKVASNQKLSTEVLNQFTDRGVPLLQFVAKQYGVTSAAAQQMVTDGKVSFADFQNALEKGVGGAALASGETARGAFANVGAALSRIGAQFATPIVGAAPALFQAIAGATDRAGTALTPYTDALAAKLVPALQSATKWVNGFDPGVVIRGIGAVFTVLRTGSAQGVALDIVKLVGLDKAATVETIAARVGAVVRGLVATIGILFGDGSLDNAIKLNKAFGFDAAPVIFKTATTLHGVAAGLRDAIAGIFSGAKAGDASEIGTSLGTIVSVARPLFPIFAAVARGVADVSGQIGDVLSGAVRLAGPLLDIFARGLNFLADNTQLLVPILIAVGSAMLIYRTAQAAANVAELGALPIRAATIGSNILLANAQRALAIQLAIANGQQRASLLSMLPATAQVIIQTAAKVGAAVATGAMAVATGVATAAQWLFNAALTANPIGIVVVAIAALVAGLIYFFTQTKVGQAAWSAFTGFLGTAWGVIKTLFVAGVAFVGVIWRAFWAFISAPPRLAFAVISIVIRTGIALARAVISAGLGAIRGLWSAGFNFLSSIARTAFGAIRLVISSGIAVVRTVISAGLAIVKAIFTGNWGAIPGIVRGAVSQVLAIAGGLISGIKGALGKVTTAFSNLKSDVVGALAGAGSWLVSVGSNIIQGMISGIKGAAKGVISAITGVAGSAISGAKKLLGIHSPSTVFRAIGGFVMAGLANGIKSGASAVSTQMTRAINLIVSSKDIPNGARAGLANYVSQQNTALQTLADRHDKILDKLKAAEKNYTKAVKVRTDYKNSVLSGLTAFDPTASFGAASTSAALRTQIGQVKTFTTVMARLKRLGLDNTTYKAFIAKGTDSLGSAQALLAGGRAGVKNVAALQKQLTKASSGLANSAATSLYGPGVDAAKGLVKGLQSQAGSLAKAMSTLAGNLVSEIKKKLGIHSPSTVFAAIGQFITSGLHRGIDTGALAVSRSATRLADITTAAFSFATPTNALVGSVAADNDYLGALVADRLKIASRLATASTQVAGAAGTALTTPHVVLPADPALNIAGSTPPRVDASLTPAALRDAAATMVASAPIDASTDESVNFNGPVTVADPDVLVKKLNKGKQKARLSKPRAKKVP